MRFLKSAVLLMALMHSINLMAQDDESADGASSANRYIDLKPAFVVNYGGVGRLRYLKTDIALRVGGDIAGSNGIRKHMPFIRHVLVMRLSQATEEELSSMEGRELLRQDTLEAVRAILMKEEGEQFVEDLLFNSFIVQR